MPPLAEWLLPNATLRRKQEVNDECEILASCYPGNAEN
jgi:hypothetical protein